ncbi:beta strand repeat-containing protein [Hymenobacter cheonanensis]|uniref:beta strand repeat-containing protein n=1 Tax=Hymenobacter sp. CA2-7 TaxID=3063993 RepID=UPI002713F796|nr:T9SS type A sorting domain-containing protein [Hymenobacter sp. CA2-7]MDO7885020.1 T9SS type A sorting domain-containing protein [Hymenobacter sp. CA2-7]
MRNITLKRERQRDGQSRFQRALTSLLAMLAIFSVSQSALAQTVSSVYYNDAITLTQQTSGSTSASTPTNYAGTATESPYLAYAKLGKGSPSQNLGTYDVTGTSQLVLNGGSIEADPPGATKSATYTIAAARFRYRVYMQGTVAPAYNTVPLPANGTLNGSMYFSTSSANINLLAGLTTGGNYILEVVFQTDTQSSTGTQNTDQDPASTTYQALFTLTAPPAPTLSGTTVYVAPNGGANSIYNVNPATPNPYQGSNLGSSYDINGGQLILNGGSAATTEAGSRVISNVTLYYRVRPQNGSGGAFNFISLPQTSNSNGSRSFATSTANINLVSLVSTPGTYTLDIYYQASGTDNSTSPNPTSFTLIDNNGGQFYNANFTVTGTAIKVTRWVGGKNDNWFDAANWNNGIPDRNVNAEIQNLGSGVKNPYPNIYAATTYTYTAPDSTKTFIDNTAYSLAEARNLTMLGSSQANRSILRLVVGTLNVYGDFDNTYDSFIARDNTTVGFVGTNQTISSGSFSSVRIAGGGTKSLQGAMNVNQAITFVNGLLVTDITQPTVSVVVLADRANINNNQGAQLVDERDAAYLRGFVRTTRANTTVGDTYTYGNIGMQLIFSGNNPGPVDVTRNTAEAYNPVSTTSGIRRIFGVRPGNPNTNSGGLYADMQFRYLNSETKGLGQSGNITIAENNLSLFLSTNSGNTFVNLGRTAIDTVSNTLTANGVTSFATFTLGDRTNPLPVHLVAFDAKRLANNTLVTWATADETNSAGFEVQVSTDGKTYRKLAFVASYSATSNQYQTYSYTDIESGKSGLRYYRLRQIDVDGTSAYSPVKVVSFATIAAGATSVNIYPNPSASSDLTTLVVQSPVAGAGRIQVLDMTGRSIVSRDITTVAGVTELAVPVGSELNAGIYLVKVTLPSGETKTVRMQKR